MTRSLPLGPVMIDVSGSELSADDRRRLMHPLTGGVILFSRNYNNPEQLTHLTREIHSLRSPTLIIAVDHEGGRVQRFREGFTAIPAMRELGHAWDASAQRARQNAHAVGFVLAAELRAHGVDLTFAPVLDLDCGESSVIGDRALHADADVVTELARALLQGFRHAGMSGVGKHFPGHGHVSADSHLEVPVDERGYEEIEASDIVPFRRLIGAGLGGIMPAHVVYSSVDHRPAGFSPVWLKEILRGDLGFDGIIFSDDLNMEGASIGGSFVERTRAALEAGCDMVLICNNAPAVDEVYGAFSYSMPAVSLARLGRMHGRPQAENMIGLREDARYTQALHAMSGIGVHDGELPLGT
ncbi:MAG TPA: beta-N-acetylhexosaminidase [Burkholderiales bacterium]|nr:beta-N-acetylhexosaminidase [Burkholderiales bacterium]